VIEAPTDRNGQNLTNFDHSTLYCGARQARNQSSPVNIDGAYEKLLGYYGGMDTPDYQNHSDQRCSIIYLFIYLLTLCL
jgi:hypothetical protein